MEVLIIMGVCIIVSIITQIILHKKDTYGTMEITSTEEADKCVIKFDEYVDFRKKKRMILHIKVIDKE